MSIGYQFLCTGYPDFELCTLDIQLALTEYFFTYTVPAVFSCVSLPLFFIRKSAAFFIHLYRNKIQHQIEQEDNRQS